MENKKRMYYKKPIALHRLGPGDYFTLEGGYHEDIELYLVLDLMLFVSKQEKATTKISVSELPKLVLNTATMEPTFLDKHIEAFLTSPDTETEFKCIPYTA